MEKKITGDSYLVVKQFDVKNGNFTGEPFNFGSLRSTLEDHIIISGINRPGMLFETIEKDPHSKYEKIILDYTVGLDKIYDRKELKRKRMSRNS